MPIAKVQSTTPVSSTGSIVLTFSATPIPGALITVPFSTYRNGNTQTVTSVVDNQSGNTYKLAKATGDSNGNNSFIYYAYNVNSSGTFTVTVTMSLGNTQIMGTATEWSGFGAADPIVGSGSAISVNPPTCTTGATGISPVAVVACMTTFRLNFNLTAITVDASSPAWTQEYQQLSNTIFTLVCESDSRVVSSSGTEAVTWTITGASPGNPCCCIAAFNGTPPIADVIDYQISRQVMELDGTVQAVAYQIARQVMYPFTCTPGPPPPPPGASGCVDELSNPVPASKSGCIPQL